MALSNTERISELEDAIRSHQRENTYVTNEDAVLYATLRREALPDVVVLPANVQRVIQEGIRRR